MESQDSMTSQALIIADYCGLFLDIETKALSNPQAPSPPSSFERNLNSKYPQAIRTYKKHLKKNVEQNKCEKRHTI